MLQTDPRVLVLSRRTHLTWTPYAGGNTTSSRTRECRCYERRINHTWRLNVANLPHARQVWVAPGYSTSMVLWNIVNAIRCMVLQLHPGPKCLPAEAASRKPMVAMVSAGAVASQVAVSGKTSPTDAAGMMGVSEGGVYFQWMETDECSAAIGSIASVSAVCARHIGEWRLSMYEGYCLRCDFELVGR